MNSIRSKMLVAGLLSLSALLCVGCELNAGAAARSSLTSFFNSLASTAITNALNPD